MEARGPNQAHHLFNQALQIFRQKKIVEAHEKVYPAENFPLLTALALRVLTIFPSTYICGSIFSKMNFIKNDKRTHLTDEHLNDLIRVVSADVITEKQYDTVMVAKRVFHSSH